MKYWMLIVDGPRGGEWLHVRPRSHHYIPPTVVDWNSDPDPLMDVPDLRRLTPHQYQHPAWRVLLWLMTEEYPPAIPDGTVMPGWVQGQPLEQCLMEDKP